MNIRRSPFGREELEIAERGIDDVHVAVAVGRDLLGPREVAELLADAAESVQIAARGVEHLDAEIAAVDDVEVAVAAHREVARQVELARALAALADVEEVASEAPSNTRTRWFSELTPPISTTYTRSPPGSTVTLEMRSNIFSLPILRRNLPSRSYTMTARRLASAT
jgi:hypothetical protein